MACNEEICECPCHHGGWDGVGTCKQPCCACDMQYCEPSELKNFDQNSFDLHHKEGRPLEEENPSIQERLDLCNDSILISTIEKLLPWCFEANQVCRACDRPPDEEHSDMCPVLSAEEQLSKLRGEIVP